MGTHDEMRKQVTRKFRPESRDHRLCLQKLEEAEKVIGEMETRLHGSFKELEVAKAEADERDQKYNSTIGELRKKIEHLEDEVKHERRRATQALDVAESTSNASWGIGRLLHSIVDKDVLEELRISSQERREKARESMRHRRPG